MAKFGLQTGLVQPQALSEETDIVEQQAVAPQGDPLAARPAGPAPTNVGEIDVDADPSADVKIQQVFDAQEATTLKPDVILDPKPPDPNKPGSRIYVQAPSIIDPIAADENLDDVVGELSDKISNAQSAISDIELEAREASITNTQRLSIERVNKALGEVQAAVKRVEQLETQGGLQAGLITIQEFATPEQTQIVRDLSIVQDPELVGPQALNVLGQTLDQLSKRSKAAVLIGMGKLPLAPSEEQIAALDGQTFFRELTGIDPTTVRASDDPEQTFWNTLHQWSLKAGEVLTDAVFDITNFVLPGAGVAATAGRQVTKAGARAATREGVEAAAEAVTKAVPPAIPIQQTLTDTHALFAKNTFDPGVNLNFQDAVAREFSTDVIRLPSGIQSSDADMFTRYYAASSPLTNPETHLTEARKAFDEWKAGKPFSTTFPVHRHNFERITKGLPLDSKVSRKVTEFYASLTGDTHAVVPDNWLASVYGFKGLGKMSNDQVDFMIESVRREAYDMGVTPRDFQAALFAANQTLKGSGKDIIDLRAQLMQEVANNPTKFINAQRTNGAFTPLRGEAGSANFLAVWALARTAIGAGLGTAFAPSEETAVESAVLGATIANFPALLRRFSREFIRAGAGRRVREAQQLAALQARATRQTVRQKLANRRSWTDKSFRELYDQELREFRIGVTRPDPEVVAEAEFMRRSGQINEDYIMRIHAGSTLNDAQIRAVSRVMVESGNHLKRLAAQLDPNDQESIRQFVTHFHKHSRLDVRRLGVARETGGALRTFEEIEDESQFLARFTGITSYLNKGTDPVRLARMVLGTQTQQDLNVFVRNATRPGAFDLMTEFWLNGLLSGPKTLAANVSGNGAFMLMNIGERALAPRMRLFSRQTNEKARSMDRVVKGEATAMIMGYMTSFRGSMRALWQAMRDEEKYTSVIGKFETRKKFITDENMREIPGLRAMADKRFPIARGLEFVATQIGKASGNKHVGPIASELEVFTRSLADRGAMIRMPGRLLVATDEAFKHGSMNAELSAQAWREAVLEAEAKELTGKQTSDFVNERYRALLEQPPDAAIKKSKEYALYSTFQNQLGPAGRKLQELAAISPWARLAMPFVRTPINLFKTGLLERTPLAAFNREVQQKLAMGGPEADIMRARIGFGAGLGLTFMWFAANGVITPGGAKDPNLRRQQQQEGYTPYALNVTALQRFLTGEQQDVLPQKGDKYVQLSRVEPLGMIMGLAADVANIGAQLDRGDYDTLTAALIGITAKQSSSKTFVKGAAETLSALADPSRYADNAIEDQLGTLIPFSSLVTNATRELDPEIKDVRNWVDAVQARVYPFSENVPCMRDVFAECLTFRPGFGPDMISPLSENTQKDPTIMRAFEEDQVAPSLPSRTINVAGRPFELSPRLYERLQILSGKELTIDGLSLRGQINRIIREAEDSGPFSDRAIDIRGALSEYRKEALEVLKETEPELQRAIRRVEEEQERSGVNVQLHRGTRFNFEVR